MTKTFPEMIRWKTLARSGEAYFIAYRYFADGERFAMHTHDFAEITLIEAGEGRQVLNGVDRVLHPGDLFLMRPSDEHSMEAGRRGLGVANFAFRAEHAVALERRYLPERFPCFRSKAKQPVSVHLHPKAFAQAVNLCRTLNGAARDWLELDRALLDIFAILRKTSEETSRASPPEWLECACSKMQSPDHLAERLRAFFRLAGRSKEHVARKMREHGGCSPTQFVRRLRLDHAARLLCTTQVSVLEIALDCGFESLGHFHDHFKSRFQMTPLQYRKRTQGSGS